MPTLTINGKSITVEPGTSVLVAAKRLGIQIPHFCWHPYLSVAGNCRMCLVEIEKIPKLAISCATPAADGMVVRTDTEQVKDAVQGVLEFLLLNHPIDCPICDQAGECYLQDYYMDHGLHESRIDRDDKVAKGKAIDLGPIVLDQERCVLCSRCVRYTTEVSRTGELYLFERGNRTEIRTFNDRPLTGPYTGNLADVCPVGALTGTDFRFKKRVWFLKPVPSVCHGCATGCNVWVDQQKSVVYRLRPRDNHQVNKLWMCDPGRETYKELHTDDRLTTAERGKGSERREVSRDEALRDAAAMLADGPASVGMVVSSRLSLEDLFAAGRLADALGVTRISTWLQSEQDDPSAAEDEILRSRDPFPNTNGARVLGIIPEGSTGRTETESLIEAVKGGQIKTLLIAGADDLEGTPAGASLLAELSALTNLIVLASRRCGAVTGASVIIPTAMWAERDGTVISGRMRVQRFRRAIEPPSENTTAPFSIFLALLRILGHPVPEQVSADEDSARQVFRWMTDETPALSEVSMDRIGSLGLSLVPEEESAGAAQPQGATT